MAFVLPTGERIRVDGNPHGFFGAWGAMAWARGPRESRRLHTAVVGSTRAALDDDGVLETADVRAVSYAGGRLEAIEARDRARTTVLWSGDLWELSTTVAARSVDLGGQVDFLAGFQLREAAEGLVVAPRPGLQLTVDRVLAANNVPRVCALTVQRAAEAADLLPRWRGAVVTGGELWRDSYPAEDRRLPMALLANRTAVAALYGSTAAGAEERLADLAARLRVTVETV